MNPLGSELGRGAIGGVFPGTLEQVLERRPLFDNEEHLVGKQSA
jgi:hypothetical protein